MRRKNKGQDSGRKNQNRAAQNYSLAKIDSEKKAAIATRADRSSLIWLYITLPLVVGLIIGIFWRSLYHEKGDDSPLMAKPMPSLSLPLIEGNGMLRSDSVKKGSVSVVNIFASWCVPCQIELPLLAKTKNILRHQEHQEPMLKPVKFIGIAWEDKLADARLFLARYGHPYDMVAIDSDGRAMIDWGLIGVPETYVVDGDGIIRYRKIGAIATAGDIDELVAAIKKWRE